MTHMPIEVLVASLEESCPSKLIDRLNLQTPAIICNQTDRYDYWEIERSNGKVRWFDFDERGVGLNRNNSLIRSTGEICLIADDDMTFVDGYSEIVEKSFSRNPNADVIIFNIKESTPTRTVTKREKRVTRLSAYKYGAARIAFRRQSILNHRICFSQLFGGGACYSAGEDVLFVVDCIKSRLNIIAVPDSIALLNEERDSTWFKGYSNKLFQDKGALYLSADGYLMGAIHCVLNALLHHNRYRMEGYSLISVIRQELKGLHSFSSSARRSL
ncbi:putative uncharacterized protein [Eggerthella sp. CAG:1427]|nr:putative uncharacterized protein [Eggerthella sp. CAG:1427]